MDSTQPSTSKIYTIKFEHHWKIFNFSNLLSENSSSFVYSEAFPPKTEKFQFSLRLQPKNLDKNGDSYLSIFLHLQESKHLNLKTTYQISLLKHEKNSTEFNVKKEKEVDFSSDFCRGFTNFISHEKLMPLLDDILTIVCQITIDSLENIQIEATKSSSTFTAHECVLKFTNKWIVDDFSVFYYDNLNKIEATLKLEDWLSENNTLKFYPVLVMTNEKQAKLENEKWYISLYLFFESDLIEEVMASYRLSILDWKNQLYVTGEGFENFISKGDGKGPKYFISCDDLMDLHKGLLRRDKLTIFARIEISDYVTANEKKSILKLMELKEKVIGWKISKEISDVDWWKYWKRNDEKWIQENGLKILLSDEVMEMIEKKSEDEVREIFDYNFITKTSVASLSVQNLLVQLFISMSDLVHLNSDIWNRHRVLCWVIGEMVRCGDVWSEETSDCLVEYLVKLIEQCDDMKIVKWIIITEWWLKIDLRSSTKQKILTALHSHASFLAEVNITRDYEHVDLEKYQVGWCAKWWIDNVHENKSNRIQMPLLKLSHDRCEVRNDTENRYLTYPISIPVRSSFQVTSGVYYYEVITLTGGDMRFGWATRKAELSEWGKIGDNKHSIGLEMGQHFRIHHQGIHTISNQPISQLWNVIGCMIDVDNRQFVFYFNGQKLEWKGAIHFSSLPYYATASFSSSQHCRFNFSETPFKMPPKNIQFKYFNQSNQNLLKTQLTETVKYGNYFWFAHLVMDNQVSLFYCDPEQVECDELVRQLEHIEHNQTTRLDHSVECGRLVQSVIEVVKRRLTSGKNDLITRLVRKVIVTTTDFEKSKLLELLYPYLQLSVTSTNSSKCHNICLIMLYFNDSFFVYKLIENFDKFFLQTITTFINSRIFITDPWTMIYVFNFLERSRLPHTTQLLRNDPSLKSTLNWCSELFGQVSSVSQLYEPSCDLVRLQAGMCARWFRDHVMHGEEKHFPSQSTLNPEDRNRNIKLSCDCLSARNDYEKLQSVRSVSSVSSNIFYYEAVLLTEGEMRIGWATVNIDLNKTVIGDDLYSIGFDGSDGHKIYQYKKNLNDDLIIPKFTSIPQWSVGDVVGSLIDCDKKMFKFYLNGKLVKCLEEFNDENDYDYILHFSSEPYYAAISLGRHQQCYLNLGQCPFRHPPSVSFITFHDVSPTPPPPPLHSPRLSECYSLVEVFAKEQIELVFDDEKQKESDQIAEEMDESVSDIDNILLISEEDRLRLLQSLISSEPWFSDSRLSVHASWIAHLITQSTSANAAFPDLVAQLLYPYFTLHLTDETTFKHREVCIILASLITVKNYLKDRTNLYQQVFTYLTQIAMNSNDQCLLLFVTTCLGNMNLEQVKKQEVNLNFTIMNKLNAIQCKSSFNEDSFLSQQTHFSVQWFLANSLNTIDPTPISSKQTTLDESVKSEHLKLSPDLLTARSDYNWQSVLSVKQLVYYEVTLQTSGSMRIGWATKRSNLESNLVGCDEYSIGFDGHNRCIWHQNKRYPVKGAEQWKAGDVISCLLGKNHFAFQHNHKSIPTPSLVYFSTKPYFAAASLFTFQQCTFNFSKTDFFPRQTNFMHFDSIRRVRNSYIKVKKLVQEGESITNSIILHGAKLIASNRQITSSGPTASSSNEPFCSDNLLMDSNESGHSTIDDILFRDGLP